MDILSRRRIVQQITERMFVRVEVLDHVQLAMPMGGEDAARLFYTGMLEIPEVPKPAPLAKRGGCWFERGALKVHLGVDREFCPAKKAHPAFAVSDLAVLVKRLEAAGFHVSSVAHLDERLQVYVDDPFGNRIELIETV